jgi:4,5-dihydroxyphthalate decarboxylase
MGEDIYSYGVKPNLPTLEAATQYSYEQGLTERKLEVNELFAPETLDLFSVPVGSERACERGYVSRR